MKLHRFGVFATLVAGAAFIGCSSDRNATSGEESGSISFDLTTSEGVVITSVSYDLNTQAGADVADDTIPVPNPDSQISLGIDSLPPTAYSLAFSAVGMYNGQQVPCASQPTLFTLAPNQVLTLPAINLVCQIEVVAPDPTGSVSADVNVVIEQIPVGNVVEVFSYGPRSVRGVPDGSSCVFPAINLKVFNNDPTITYAWSASPNGTLALNATSTQGTYTCTSGGTKTLTLTGTKGAQTSSKSVTVNCDDSACTVTGPVCGDGTREGTEECDEGATPSARCTNCLITPVCGDGITDGPDGACAGGVATKPACSEQCDTAGDSATCTVNCTTKPQGNPCRECITAAPETGPVQAAYCDISTECLAAQDCVLAAGCFAPIPATCYCGPDIDNCRNTDFIPTGPCIAPIRAGAGNPPDNATVLDRFFDFGFPTGVGMLVLDEASRVCASACPSLGAQ